MRDSPAWVTVFLDLRRNPKTFALDAIFGRRNTHIYPINLWCWAGEHAKDGYISANNPAELASIVETACQWEGESGILFRALTRVGFLDRLNKPTRKVFIHDWKEGAGRYILEHEKKLARQRRHRAKKINVRPSVERPFHPSVSVQNTEMTNVFSQEASLRRLRDVPETSLRRPEMTPENVPTNASHANARNYYESMGSNDVENDEFSENANRGVERPFHPSVNVQSIENVDEISQRASLERLSRRPNIDIQSKSISASRFSENTENQKIKNPTPHQPTQSPPAKNSIGRQIEKRDGGWEVGKKIEIRESEKTNAQELFEKVLRHQRAADRKIAALEFHAWPICIANGVIDIGADLPMEERGAIELVFSEGLEAVAPGFGFRFVDGDERPIPANQEGISDECREFLRFWNCARREHDMPIENWRVELGLALENFVAHVQDAAGANFRAVIRKMVNEFLEDTGLKFLTLETLLKPRVFKARLDRTCAFVSAENTPKRARRL